MHARTQTYTHSLTHTHVLIHARTRAHTHTHTHTRVINLTAMVTNVCTAKIPPASRHNNLGCAKRLSQRCLIITLDEDSIHAHNRPPSMALSSQIESIPRNVNQQLMVVATSVHKCLVMNIAINHSKENWQNVGRVASSDVTCKPQ